jgi:hypothetical protein
MGGAVTDTDSNTAIQCGNEITINEWLAWLSSGMQLVLQVQSFQRVLFSR